MSLLKWPHVALEMGAGAHCARTGTKGRVERRGGPVCGAPCPRSRSRPSMLLRHGRPGPETVGEVFSQDRFRQSLVKQMIEVRKGPWSSLSSYRCRRWQNSWWM